MTRINTDLGSIMRQSFEIDLPENISKEELFEKLSSYINNLIRSDFQKLVSILYRVDVNEKRLKQLIEKNPDKDAGMIIAELIIERQLQKIKSRQQYKADDNISDDQKW